MQKRRVGGKWSWQREKWGRSLYFLKQNWCNDWLMTLPCRRLFVSSQICTESATYLEHLSLEFKPVFCLLFARVSAVRAAPSKCQLYHTVAGNCNLKTLCPAHSHWLRFFFRFWSGCVMQLMHIVKSFSLSRSFHKNIAQWKPCQMFILWVSQTLCVRFFFFPFLEKKSATQS